MSWLFSRVLVEEYLGENFSDGEQSAPLSGSHIQLAYCAPDKMTDFSRLSRFGMMFKHLTENRGEELLTLFRAGFHAKTYQQPEKAQGLTENDQECGVTWRGWLAKYDQDSSLWRTAQCSFLEDLNESLATLPRSGMTRNGLLWELPMLEQTIRGTEFGLSEKLPTPQASDHITKKTSASWKAKGAVNFSLSNPDIQAKWPTPRSCSAMAATITDKGDRFPNLETVMARMDKTTIGGKLNPMWVEWLMGWPIGWTDLKPLVTDKSHCVQQQHGKS
jgi:hypothetical protein